MRTLQGILPFLYFGTPLLAAGGVWLWLRRRDARTHIVSPGSVVSRTVETAAWAMMTSVCFVFLLTNPDKGGLLLRLHDLRPQFVIVYLTLAAVVLLILILLLRAAYLGKTRGAVCLTFAVLYVYAFIQDGPFDLMRGLVRLILMEVLS
jgi:hypothetical protein